MVWGFGQPVTPVIPRALGGGAWKQGRGHGHWWGCGGTCLSNSGQAGTFKSDRMCPWPACRSKGKKAQKDWCEQECHSCMLHTQNVELFQCNNPNVIIWINKTSTHPRQSKTRRWREDLDFYRHKYLWKCVKHQVIIYHNYNETL